MAHNCEMTLQLEKAGIDMASMYDKKQFIQSIHKVLGKLVSYPLTDFRTETKILCKSLIYRVFKIPS